MSTDLVLLAVLMGAVTYPSRALPMLAPGIERLPPRALLYLRLVGPAVLASIAASQTLVHTNAAGVPQIVIGPEILGVLAVHGDRVVAPEPVPRPARRRRARRAAAGRRDRLTGGAGVLALAGLRLDLDQQARA